MKCQLEMNDVLTVRDVENPNQVIHLDASRFYCRLFENARDQSRDYLEEIMKWAKGDIENYDYLSDNLMHFTSARRRYYGFKK